MKTIITDNNFDCMWKKLASDNQMQNPKLSFETFKDNWPNLFIDQVKDAVEHRDITYIWDFSRPENMFINYSAIRWLLDYYADKVRIIMPYFPVGTMERIDTKGQVATAKYFAEIMSLMPPGRHGKTSIHIFDIHALVERFLFDSHKINAEMHTAMSLLKKEVEWKTLVFPDEWAQKRFWRDFPDNEVVICSKVRDWNRRIVTVKEWDPRWKDLIIIDDLIQTWGTIMETADLLRDKWANTVISYATHWVFPGDSHKILASRVDKLIVTDTIPENIARAKDTDNMEVISIQWLVEKIIRGE